MDYSCPGCFPGSPDDVAYQAAKNKASEQSEKNNEPVAIYKEAGEYKCINAFTAYANHYAVREVVSTYNRNAT
jgi:hypothetical protein